MTLQARIFIIILLFFAASCGDNYDYDGPRPSYVYFAVLAFADTNEIIQSIYYPDVNKTDSPASNNTVLKLSDNVATRISLQSTHFQYQFTFKLNFKTKAEGSFDRNYYGRTFEGLEIVKSDASELRVKSVELPDTLRWSYRFFSIDSIIIR